MSDTIRKEVRTIDGVDFHISCLADYDADISYLGEFVDGRRWTPGAIDRKRAGHWARGEYEYFIPECNAQVQNDIRGYWSVRGESKHQAWLKGQQQAKHEYELAENHGTDWWTIGIAVSIDVDGEEVASASLWGIEDGYLGPDANTEAYQEEIIQELINECKAELNASAYKYRKLADRIDAIAV